MKILIMGFTKIKYMPYMNFYLDNLSKENDEIHILYWNRDLKNEELSKYGSCVLHEFKYYQEDDVSKLSKLKSFAVYRKNAKKLLENESFDFIFVLHSLTGVVVADVLKKRYSGRYIFDYRDATYEGFAPFKRIVASLTRHSAATFVSSDAFRPLLPEDCKEKTYTSHNLLLDSLNHRDERKVNGIPSDKIRIAFWGFIRHEKINREIIKKIAADTRFELHYYGREQEIALSLKEYAKELSAENVFFHGEYVPEDRYNFIRSTDIIHNLYGNDELPPTLNAMGNKYYDGIIFKIPQLCTAGSFMAEKVNAAGVGFSCTPYDTDFTDKVFEYFGKIDSVAFETACNTRLDSVLNEYNAGIKIIKKEVYNEN